MCDRDRFAERRIERRRHRRRMLSILPTAFLVSTSPALDRSGALRTFQGGSAVLYPFASWELKCVERAILRYATEPNVPELRVHDDPASHHGQR